MIRSFKRKKNVCYFFYKFYSLEFETLKAKLKISKPELLI